MKTKHPFVLVAMAAFAAFGEPNENAFTVDKNVPAGNLVVEKIVGDNVYVHQELRDTKGPWFYWACRATGAAGRTLTFTFTQSAAVGTRGPCVSLDKGQTWLYAAEKTCTRNAFTYTVPADADEVWFYETIPYLQSDWDAFLIKHAKDRGTAFETGVLCQSRKGRDVEKARFGCLSKPPKHRVFLSARHHCSESMASFVLEGVLEGVLANDETGAWLRDNVEFMVVPFVDKDGCEEGDQGKNRQPHDHNRDYTAFIYPETRAIRDWIHAHAGNKLDIFFAFHCPWLFGTSNEWVYQVQQKDPSNTEKMVCFGKLLEKMQTGSMAYRQANDIRWNTGWNTPKNYSAGTCATDWALKELDCGFGSTYEIPFATANGKTVTPASCRELGRDTAGVYRAFLTRETPAPLATAHP